MTNTKLQKISNILETANATGGKHITRKEMISLAKEAGLVEKDCYFVITNTAKYKGARGTYFIEIMNDIVNRAIEKNKSMTIMRDILYTHGESEISRKTFIEKSVEAGLVERDTYRLTISANKSSARGSYNVNAMIKTAEKVVGKSSIEAPVVETAPKDDSVDQINAMFDRILEEEAALEAAVAQPKGKCYGYEPIAPNEDDIADELALMGAEIA